MSIDISQGVKRKIIERYLGGMSPLRSGRKFGLGKYTVRLILQDANISLRKGNTRFRAVDETFFDSLDREEKEWALGMFITDGSIDKNGVRISLQMRDKDAIEKLQNALKSTHPIRVQTTNESYIKEIVNGVLTERVIRGGRFARVIFNSKHLKQALTALIHSSAIGGLKPTRIIPLEKLRPIGVRNCLRGLVDGDGSIGRSQLYLCGTFKIIESFGCAIEKYIGISQKDRISRDKRCNTFYINYYGSDARKVAEYLYLDAKIYLDRKMQRAEELVGHPLRAGG